MTSFHYWHHPHFLLATTELIYFFHNNNNSNTAVQPKWAAITVPITNQQKILLLSVSFRTAAATPPLQLKEQQLQKTTSGPPYATSNNIDCYYGSNNTNHNHNHNANSSRRTLSSSSKIKLPLTTTNGNDITAWHTKQIQHGTIGDGAYDTATQHATCQHSNLQIYNDSCNTATTIASRCTAAQLQTTTQH